MKALLISEYRKFVSTRLWWILLASMALYMCAVAAMSGALFAFTDAMGASEPNGEPLTLDPATVPQTVYTTAAALGYIFPALIGALSFTGEFRHKTITPTFIATPNRTKVVLAKLLGGVPLGLTFGIVGTLASVLGGAGILLIGDVSPQLDTLYAWEIIGRAVLALTLWLLLGVALGCTIKNQAVIVVVLIAFTQMVEPTLRLVLTQWEAGAPIGKFLPGAVSDAIAGGSLYTAMGAGPGLPFWAAMLVMFGYIAVFATIGRLTTLRGDVN